LLYRGAGGGVWSVCDNPRLEAYELYLSLTGPIQREGCIGGVTVMAEGRIPERG
jgi:hypothetical protein